MADWAIPAQENAYRSSAPSDLEALALADEASRVLCDLIQEVKIPPAEEEVTPTQARRHAIWFLGIVAFRGIRAAMATFSAGYEEQALGYLRLIEETHTRAQAIRKDQSGEVARKWLAGINVGKGSKLVGQEYWEWLSGPHHANARAVLDWLAISQPDGSTRVRIGPERRPDMTNPTLTIMAGECRDVANLLALETELPLDLRALDAKIKTAMATHVPDPENDHST